MAFVEKTTFVHEWSEETTVMLKLRRKHRSSICGSWKLCRQRHHAILNELILRKTSMKTKMAALKRSLETYKANEDRPAAI